jgi:hypothetical protein
MVPLLGGVRGGFTEFTDYSVNHKYSMLKK